ncbi:hypothetical protein BA768_11160 [Chryseobacterium sp. CBo1]|uniref:EpsG family protein n=1 Tax=Chryseobacterium sp. CBo1 TaxID=1869230 RepID=UPI000810E67A|nr:hypothetical protein BA768_11160 [Chryseobacterium sp. CBo1]
MFSLEETSLYQSLLFLVLVLFALVKALNLFFKKRDGPLLYDIVLFVYVLCYSLLISYKEIAIGSDFSQYEYEYYTLSSFKQIFNLKGDYLFYLIAYFCNLLGFTFGQYIFALLTTINFLILKALKTFSEKNIFLIFFILCSCFFYYSMTQNIIRQGLGFAFFLCGLAGLYERDKKKFIIYFSVAFLMHLVYIVPLTLLYVFTRIKKTMWIYLLLLICSLISALNYNIFTNAFFTSVLNVERLRSYGSAGSDEIVNYKLGFRIDFFLFNLFFIFISYKILQLLKKNKYKVDFYNLLHKLFVVMSSLFFLMFHIPFSDRFGLLSWMLIPLLFIPVFTHRLPGNIFINPLTIVIFFTIIYFVFNI